MYYCTSMLQLATSVFFSIECLPEDGQDRPNCIGVLACVVHVISLHLNMSVDFGMYGDLIWSVYLTSVILYKYSIFL
jgi:hypothetical protein